MTGRLVEGVFAFGSFTASSCDYSQTWLSIVDLLAGIMRLGRLCSTAIVGKLEDGSDLNEAKWKPLSETCG